MTKLSDPKKIYSWAMFDWANSAFSTTVMAGFFPVFFKGYWSQGADSIVTTARLGMAVSISSLLIALMSPTLGVIADLKGFKKRFSLLFMFIGALSCIFLAVVPMGGWWSAILLYGLAMMCFNASSVFSDSLLPFVAKGKEMDHVSSLGYSLGYLGGGILFLVNVFMYLKPEFFGFRDGVQAVQASFISVGVWWIIFSFPLAKNIPEPPAFKNTDSIFQLTKLSVAAFRKTVATLKNDRNILYFLLAYWLYIDGVYTVMTMAVDYGIALGFETKDLIVALLITQFVGFPFAYGFSYLAKWWGTKIPILICIVIYSVAVVAATKMDAVGHFYILATVIGMVQGGVQGLSRSFFARMVPLENSGEYFGLFNLVGKFATILGPLIVAVGVTMTGSNRYGMLGLLVLFILGGALLCLVKEVAHPVHPADPR